MFKMTGLKDIENAFVSLTADELLEIPALLELAQKWYHNDIIKMQLAVTYDDMKKDMPDLPLEAHICYYLEHPFLLGDTSTLVGLKEFAELIGWDKARLSTKFSRQREGKKVRPMIPEPIQILSATPVWTKAQVMHFKEKLETKKASQS
jgi:hypothetical protein